MNQKLIAAAVAAVVVAPVASYGDVTVYGNITNALVSADDGTNSTTDVSTVGSRIGVKASSDLGNGLSASGQYEFATTSDTANDALHQTRVAKVGLSGGFGSFEIGQQWSAFYQNFNTMVSPNYTVSVPQAYGATGALRTSNTLKYTNSFGPVSLGIDLRVDDDSDGARDGQGDGFGIGVTFNPASNLTIGVAYDDADGLDMLVPRTADAPDSNVFGIAARADFGDFWVSGGYQTAETDEVDTIPYEENSGNNMFDAGSADLAAIPGAAEIEIDYFQLWVGTTLGEQTSLTVGYGSSDSEQGPIDREVDGLAFAVNHDMGGGLHFFFEYTDSTTEVTGADDVDSDNAYLGMRLNF